jgi:hypothetical protein
MYYIRQLLLLLLLLAITASVQMKQQGLWQVCLTMVSA